mgnify:CR=1 FL=1
MKKIFAALFAFIVLTATHSPATAGSAVPDNPSAVASANTDYNPVVTHMNVREHKGWKATERYAFSYIIVFHEIYNPEEPIEFTVEGKSDALYVDEANGFSVFATMFDLSRSVGSRATVEYDAGRRIWNIKLTAPKDSGKDYKIVLNLFCRKNNTPCADTYGYGTQIDKTLSLRVR